MIRRSTRACVGLMAVGLLTAGLAMPAAAKSRSAAPAAQQGVTKDGIDVVLIYPDIDTLKSKGVASRSSNKAFADKFTAYVDEFGPINGRKINIVSVPWDPIDPTSFDRVCTQATQDNKPFVVVNGTGYQTAAIPCIAIDNKTPFVYGDEVGIEVQKAAGKNLVTLREPPEVTAATAAAIIAKTKLIPKTAKIGIVSNNEPTLKAGGDKLEASLKKKGYDVVSKVEINGLSSNLGTISQGASAAADTMKAAGVDTVIHTQSFQAIRPFFQQAEKIQAPFKYVAMDTQANSCQVSGGATAQLPASAAGLQCITPHDHRTLPDLSGLRKDTAFEAKCREQYESASGLTTTPGVFSGGAEINGVTYENDFPDKECNLATVLLGAMKKAGKNLTWDKVYANILKTSNVPAAAMSDGKGGYSKKKLYFPNKAQVVELHYADKTTPQDANGLYNGCPVPASCLVPKEFGSQRWFPIQSS